VELTVRARPRSSRPGLGPFRNGMLEVRLAAPPVDGAANAELVETLARALGLPRRAVTLVAGEHARTKRCRIEGLSSEEVSSRLEATSPTERSPG
jgi:uncharacterized protein